MTDQSHTIAQRAAAANQDSGVMGHAGAVAATCPRTAIEIGVFFDGTGNNETNVALGASVLNDASYASTRSNVSLLEDLYKRSRESDWEQDSGGYCRKFTAIYVPGIGTTNDERDDTIGFGTGMGPTGVEARVFQACIDVGLEIAGLSPASEPTEIVLDVFGFSRGAAAARYFVNCFRQGFIRYNALDWSIWRGLHYDRNVARIPDGRNVRIRFVGIFDTVAAIGIGTDDDNGDVNVHMSTAQADRIYHLTARHEYRANFRLNHNIPGGGDTRELIGAHSDIGGGYGDGTEHQLVEREDKRVFTGRAAAERARAAEVADAANVRYDAASPWVRDGWIDPGNPDGHLQDVVGPVQVEWPPTATGGVPIPLYTFTRRVQIRREVRAGLSRIALRIMYDAAVGSGVPFTPYPSMARLYAPPEGFPPGAAETMIAGGTLPFEQRRDILQQFGHISARFDTITGAPETLRARWDTTKEALAHGPEDAWERTVYWNEAGRAK